MMTNSDIFFVANLQVYARPFTALYLDKGRGVLCLFVRISAPDTESPKYIATEVTSNQVSRYMKRWLGLRTIFKNHSCYLANINGKGVELQETPSFKPTQEMKLSNMFDPEYCYDSLKLKMFLRRYDNNEYKV
jgi:hypothetical protein